MISNHESYPKYSIIIPTYNGISYLPTCIDTITSQVYKNYELIISDDHSEDGTQEYLISLAHPNIKTIVTPHKMSMTEHWEWALTHACGEWNIFVGQDDGLQPYFFSLADILTKYAQKSQIRTIMSERAYFFWHGCEKVFGDTAISYTALSRIVKHNSTKRMLQTLVGLNSYFDLPEMYTTSLFHRDIINEARAKQHGKVFVTHPQDANLAAIACSLDKKYLQSSIPLGWVGTSVKSAGMAVSATTNNTLRDTYLDKIQSSTLTYSPQIGSFSLGLCSLYFWGALLQTTHLRSPLINTIIHSQAIKYLIFLSALNELNNQATTSTRYTEFLKVAAQNNCSIRLLNAFHPIYNITLKFCMLVRKIFNRLIKFRSQSFYYYSAQQKKQTMMQANIIISKNISKRFWEIKCNLPL